MSQNESEKITVTKKDDRFVAFEDPSKNRVQILDDETAVYFPANSKMADCKIFDGRLDDFKASLRVGAIQWKSSSVAGTEIGTFSAPKNAITSACKNFGVPLNVTR